MQSTPINHDLIPSQNSTNLKGVMIKVAAIYSEGLSEVSFLSRKAEPDMQITGYSANFLHDLIDILNFSITILPVDNTGVVLKNGKKIPKILNLLIKGEADLIISHLVPQEVYEFRVANRVDILHPSLDNPRLYTIFQQPAIDSIKSIYLHPFTFELWMAILLILLIVHIAHHFFTNRLSIMETVLQLFANISLQGSWRNLENVSFGGRTSLWLGSLMTVSVFWVYSAYLYSIITSSRIPVKNFKDLIRYNFQLVVHESSLSGRAELQNIITSNNLSQEIITTNTANEIKILGGHFSLLSYWDLFHKVAKAQNYSNTDICSTFTRIEVIQNLPRKRSWMAKKNFKFKDVFNIKLLLIRERGFTKRYLKAEVAKAAFNLYCMSNQNLLISVSGFEALSAFLIFLAGLVISIPLLIVELSIKKFKQRNNCVKK